MAKKRQPKLKAPFPAFGGKASIAHIVWERFGNVDNYIEPFFNSGAMLFKNPHGPARNETVNDLDCYIANFWRAVQARPDEVAMHADWPVSEVDMHARHRWLVESPEAIEMREKIRKSPKYYDPLIAGWWAWGICLWIGSGWCDVSCQHECLPRLHHDQGLNCKPQEKRITEQIPMIGFRQGIHGSKSGLSDKRPMLEDRGMQSKRPNLSAGHGKGTGVNSQRKPSHEVKQVPYLGGGSNGAGGSRGLVAMPSHDWAQRPELYAKGVHEKGSRPQLGDAWSGGRGVHSSVPSTKRPRIGQLMELTGQGSMDTCNERREYLVQWMRDLSDRLRNVRVCNGDWLRVCKSPTVTTRLGVTGVFLDPPYRLHVDKEGKKTKSRDAVYASDKGADLDKLNDRVRQYCLERGKEKDMRIALCSYEGEGNEVLELEGWTVFAWKSNGYGTSKAGKENAARERVWFSPHCLIPERDQYPLFASEINEENE